jgi:uncharacterized membrane protein
VPVHFGIDGKADGWSGKGSLWAMAAGIPLGLYALMLVIPVLDPKKRIGEMGVKYHHFRFILGAFFSAISGYILYVTRSGGDMNAGGLVAILGGFFAALGNYMQALRPNYFIGIRTPWTLESEEVWKSTHRLGGRMWMVGGVLLMVLGLLVKSGLWLLIPVMTVFITMVGVPVVQSYLLFREAARLKDHKH